MFVLIDAVGTLVSGDQDLTFETRELNTELADYLATLDVQIVVTSNARGERGKRIRDLMSGYSFEYFSLDNNPSKTDPEYFAHLLMYYGFDPEEGICLDHLQDNLDSANELDIK